MNLASVLLRPIITEKSRSQSSHNRFSFQVAKQATKNQIKQAIQDYFKVKVVKVNTAIMPGKIRHQGKRRHAIAGQSWKKAIIQLQEGQSLDIFETPQQDKKTKTAKKANTNK